MACLILKTMLEDIPRHGPGLADELRKAGAEIKEAAARELAEFYPDDPDGAKPIAYVWARTIVCDSCGVEIPLARSFWLCKKASRKRALKSSVRPHRGKPATIEFEVFTPHSDSQVQAGTVTRAKATCLACQTVLPPERVRAQLAAQRGGADVKFDSKGHRIGGATLLAVVTLHPNKAGRQYRIAADRDYAAVFKAMATLKKVAAQTLPNGLSPIPDEPLPPIGTLGFRVQRYGMLQWGDLFTARQKLGLCTLAKCARGQTRERTLSDLLAMLVDRAATRNSSLCLWLSQGDQETVWTTFGRQTLPIAWDFAEAVLLSESTGSFSDGVEVLREMLDDAPLRGGAVGQVMQADAAEVPLPSDAARVWFTDPPYYDAVPYADLSDFFLVWLKRALPDEQILRDQTDPDNPLSPKTEEAVQDETKFNDGRPKDSGWAPVGSARW